MTATKSGSAEVVGPWDARTHTCAHDVVLVSPLPGTHRMQVIPEPGRSPQRAHPDMPLQPCNESAGGGVFEWVGGSSLCARGFELAVGGTRAPAPRAWAAAGHESSAPLLQRLRAQPRPARASPHPSPPPSPPFQTQQCPGGRRKGSPRMGPAVPARTANSERPPPRSPSGSRLSAPRGEARAGAAAAQRASSANPRWRSAMAAGGARRSTGGSWGLIAAQAPVGEREVREREEAGGSQSPC